MRCLYARCGQPGERMALGLGFVFCETHAESARTVMRGGPMVKAPGLLRVCRRGHAVVGPNLGNGDKCKACRNATSLAAYWPDLDRDAYAEEKYREFMAGTKWDRKKVAA